MANSVSPGTATPAVTPPLKNPLIAWRNHAIVYLVVSALLFALDFLAGDPWWIQYVFAGWGIGVIGHGLAAYLKRKSGAA